MNLRSEKPKRIKNSGYATGTGGIAVNVRPYNSRDLGSTPSECQIFYLLRCVLSSMLPLRSVAKSNFVMVLRK